MKLITDNQTNTVYFSGWLKKDFPKLYGELDTILEKYNVPHVTLTDTNDYWCRDYMPIQICEDKYIQYSYNPDYLQKDKKFITNPDKACQEVSITTEMLDVIIDGGNIIKCSNSVIMTEKVFEENQCYKKEELISILEGAFGVEIIFLPWDKSEKYGHSDGVVRFISEGKVLLTNYKDYDKSFAERFRRILSTKFEVLELNYSTYDKNTWAYINFLQTEQVIILPRFNTKQDSEAFAQFEMIFPNYKGRIEMVDATKVVKKGGALNCISWNIKK